MDLSNSVVMPREDFIELSTAAWDHHPTPPSERFAQTLQTSTIFMAMAAAFSVGTWVWYRLMSQLEKEKLEHRIAAADHVDDLRKK